MCNATVVDGGNLLLLHQRAQLSSAAASNQIKQVTLICRCLQIDDGGFPNPETLGCEEAAPSMCLIGLDSVAIDWQATLREIERGVGEFVSTFAYWVFWNWMLVTSIFGNLNFKFIRI